MSVLAVVRHGQASFGAEDYDQLSGLGVAQSEALANYWIDVGETWHRLYVGPLRRHRETFRAVAAVYERRGEALPEPVFLDDLDEHQGEQVFRAALPRLAESDERLARLLEGDSADADRPSDRHRDYMRAWVDFATRWAQGEHHDPDFEDWQSFRRRIGEATRRMTADLDRSERAVAFASGGTVAAVTGAALELSDAKTIELNYLVKNGSVSEYVVSPKRFALSVFNEVPHLASSREMVTYV